MKLKESTFAIIAEKKDSISHKWFNQNIKNNKHKQHVFWDHSGEYYLYNKGNFIRCTENRPKDIPIYTESEFEALLKAEQENEAKPTISNNGESTNIVYSDFKAKPPIGLTPRKIWLEMRYNDILDAMTRYHSERKEIPLEWIGELLRLRTENEI